MLSVYVFFQLLNHHTYVMPLETTPTPHFLIPCESDHSHPSSAKVKECVQLDLHSPIRLHGLVHW